MRVGVIGGGQLGRMLALAGYPLGLRFIFLDQTPAAPGAQVGEIIIGEFDDPARLAELAAKSDVLTFDVENVPAAAVTAATGKTLFLPPVTALAVSQDRLTEKKLFAELGIAVPAYRTVDSLSDLTAAVAAIGTPAVLKTRRLGYDGRGQFVIENEQACATAFATLSGVPLILEAFVPFEREVSLIGVRSSTGETRFYPLTENTHRLGILCVSRAPFTDTRLQAEAEQALTAVMDRFDYAGVLTVEFFVHDGKLLANEMAPRVHNSGHWTIEGAVTSQFENHLRAILGLPLGATRPVGHAAMLNFIGEMPPRAAVLGISGAHYHEYGKSPRPGRKLGHATVTAGTAAERDALLEALEAAVRKLE